MPFSRKAAPFLGLATLAMLGLGASRPAQAQELVQNGGFETGDFTGWTLNSPNGFTSVIPVNPHSGAYEANFGDISPDATLSQNIATTPGGSYSFSYYFQSDGDFPNDFSASFDGKQVFSETDAPTDSGYNLYSYTTTASGSSTAIVFSGLDQFGGLDLDDVSVTPAKSATVAPELSSVASVGIVALFAGGLMLKARKRQA